MLTKEDLDEIRKIFSDVVTSVLEKKLHVSEQEIEGELVKTGKTITTELTRLEDKITHLEQKVDHEDESLKKRLKIIEDHI